MTGDFQILKVGKDGAISAGPDSYTQLYDTFQDFLMGVQEHILKGWKLQDNRGTFYKNHTLAYMYAPEEEKE